MQIDPTLNFNILYHMFYQELRVAHKLLVLLRSKTTPCKCHTTITHKENYRYCEDIVLISLYMCTDMAAEYHIAAFLEACAEVGVPQDRLTLYTR